MSPRRLNMRRSILGALMVILAAATRVSAERAIPDDNLAFPVLIKGKSGSAASGFYLNTGTAVYFVTAGHVLFDPKTKKFRDTEVELLSYPKTPSEPGRFLFVLDLAVLDKAGNVRAHPSEDIAVVKISTTTDNPTPSTPVPGMMQPVEGVAFKKNALGGIVAVGLDNVKTFAKVLVGNEIVVFGYPTSLGLQELPQLDLLRPLLRKGMVAGENPNTRSIFLDCPSYQGNSGGPVLEVDPQGFLTRFWVIGVVIQSVPYADVWQNLRQGYTNTTLLNSGYSIATPMDPVLELVK